MRKGFTIIELLVASLLLGMLMTILTMVFNQSSISWRAGMSGLADMGRVRENFAEIREEADNAFISNGKLHRITGLWRRNGSLRNRACDAPGSDDLTDNQAGLLSLKVLGRDNWSNYTPRENKLVKYELSAGSSSAAFNYTVNVKSAGPNREYNDWDDIWSFPDDFE